MKADKLTDLEWDTCWMAIRYAMNRQTIASSTLPHQLIESYYNRWTDSQKRMIAKDLSDNESDVLRWSDGKHKAFGHSTIDRPQWLKFWSACDIDNHVNIELPNGQTVAAFKANDRIYPLKEYIENPHREIYVLDSDIVSQEIVVMSKDIEERAIGLFNKFLDKLNQTNEPFVVNIDECHSMLIYFEKGGIAQHKIYKLVK
jgi:hypothetical protein